MDLPLHELLLLKKELLLGGIRGFTLGVQNALDTFDLCFSVEILVELVPSLVTAQDGEESRSMPFLKLQTASMMGAEFRGGAGGVA